MISLRTLFIALRISVAAISIPVLFLTLVACCTAPKPTEQETTFPVLLGHTTGDGYTYEIWLREDGTRYLQHRGKIMDLPQ